MGWQLAAQRATLATVLPPSADPQAEDGEGETPLGAAAAHGKLRDALAGIATGQLDADDLMMV